MSTFMLTPIKELILFLISFIYILLHFIINFSQSQVEKLKTENIKNNNKNTKKEEQIRCDNIQVINDSYLLMY